MSHGQTPVQKGALIRLYRTEVMDRVDFQYNPEEYEEDMPVEHVYSDAMGQYLPVARFAKFGGREMEVKLLFEDREGRPKADRYAARLQMFANPGPDFGPDTLQFVSAGRCSLIMGKRAWPMTCNGVHVRNRILDRDLLPRMVIVTIKLTVVSFGTAIETMYIDALRGRAGLEG